MFVGSIISLTMQHVHAKENYVDAHGFEVKIEQCEKAGNWQESNAGHLACAAHALPLKSKSLLFQRDARVSIVCLYF